MNTRAYRHPNQSATRYQPGPIRQDFAWRRKIRVSCPLPQRKSGDIYTETKCLGCVIVQQISLLVRSSVWATPQIPIVRLF